MALLLLCRRSCRGEKEMKEMLNWASIRNALYIITHMGQNGPSIFRLEKSMPNRVKKGRGTQRHRHYREQAGILPAAGFSYIPPSIPQSLCSET